MVLVGAAINMGLGIWAMHFVGMLALHIDAPVAFEPIRTLISALIAVFAAYFSFWTLLSADFKSEFHKKFFGSFILGSGVLTMHYLGVGAMRMFPSIQYDSLLFITSVLIAYVASFIGLSLFLKSARHSKRHLFSVSNLISAVVIGGAVAGVHYTGIVAANFDTNSYCTVLDVGIRFGSLAILVMGAIIAMLLFSFVLMIYEQSLDSKRVGA